MTLLCYRANGPDLRLPSPPPKVGVVCMPSRSTRWFSNLSILWGWCGRFDWPPLGGAIFLFHCVCCNFDTSLKQTNFGQKFDIVRRVRSWQCSKCGLFRIKICEVFMAFRIVTTVAAVIMAAAANCGCSAVSSSVYGASGQVAPGRVPAGSYDSVGYGPVVDLSACAASPVRSDRIDQLCNRQNGNQYGN